MPDETREPTPLSAVQARILAEIVAGTYRPTVMASRTVRWLKAAGLVTEDGGLPPKYEATEDGRLAHARHSAAQAGSEQAAPPRNPLVEAADAVAAFIGGEKDRFGRPDPSASDAMRAARAKVHELAVRYGVAGGHATVLDQCAALLWAVSAQTTGASA